MNQGNQTVVFKVLCFSIFQSVLVLGGGYKWEFLSSLLYRTHLPLIPNYSTVQ